MAEPVHGLPSREEELALAEELDDAERALWRSFLSQTLLRPRLWAGVRRLLRERAWPAEEVDALGRSLNASDPGGQNWHRAAEELARTVTEARIRGECTRLAEHVLHEVERSSCVWGEGSMRDAHVAARGAVEAHARRRKRFIEPYVPLVVMLARRQTYDRALLDDAVQDGSLGLIKAVERYERRYGVRFATYATWWIRYAISVGLREAGQLVRLPPSLKRIEGRSNRVANAFIARTGSAPSIQQLAEAAAVPVSKIVELRSLPTTHLILDGPGDAAGTAVSELLMDPHGTSALEALVRASWMEEIRNGMVYLTPHESELLRARFGLEATQHTLRELAERHGVSRERIRQVQCGALEKLRRRIGASNPERRDSRPELR